MLYRSLLSIVHCACLTILALLPCSLTVAADGPNSESGHESSSLFGRNKTAYWT